MEYVELRNISRSETTICNGTNMRRDNRAIWTITTIYNLMHLEVISAISGNVDGKIDKQLDFGVPNFSDEPLQTQEI
jgi:hypothetical protein